MNMQISVDRIVKRDLTPTERANAIYERKFKTRLNASVRNILTIKFPKAFMAFAKPKLPLSLDIYKDVLEAGCGVSTPKFIREAIEDYTGGRTYLKNLKEGAVRVDLDGNPAGIVTAGEARAARIHLARRNKLYRGEVREISSWMR